MTIIAGKKNNMVDLRPRRDASYLLNLLPEKYTFMGDTSSIFLNLVYFSIITLLQVAFNIYTIF
jgi:hypothetical protein